MNSKSGHSSVIGEKAGKIVDCEVKIKRCRVCDIAVRNVAPPRQHNCRKNHDGSSKSMEQESAVASLTRLTEKGIEVTTDEDSTIHQHISIRVPSTIRKRKTDYDHVKKSITKKLYKLRNEQKVKQLNPKIIGYFGRCFGYCLKRNKVEKLAIKMSCCQLFPLFLGPLKVFRMVQVQERSGPVHVQVISKWKTTYRSTPKRGT